MILLRQRQPRVCIVSYNSSRFPRMDLRVTLISNCFCINLIEVSGQQGSSLPHSSPVQLQTASRLAAISSLQSHIHRNVPGPVLRHLGRLVSAEDGVGQFAGSTTGVHFTLTAQQKYQELFDSSENFPEIVFSLHLLSVPSNKGEVISYAVRGYDTLYRKDWFPMRKQQYMNRIESFFERWASMYVEIREIHVHFYSY